MEGRRIAELLLSTLRLYHDPVAVTFFSEDPPSGFPRPKKRLSLCQVVAHVRETGEPVLVLPEDLHCQTAAFLCGWPFQEEKVRRVLGKFLRPEAAEILYQKRSRLPQGTLQGLLFEPLAQIKNHPAVFLLIVDALQATHLLNFYLYAEGLPELSLIHYSGAALCGTMVKAYLEDRPVLSLPCSGAFSSGKLERGELILGFSARAFKKVITVLEERASEGRVSFLGGAHLVGEDICRNCPLIAFEKK